MRFLVDNNLSPKVAAGLTGAGHEATHVREHGLSAAPDEKVMAKALADRSVLISADTDFGTLLAASRAPGPSILLVRRISSRRADQVVSIILANLPPVLDDLQRGAIVVLGEDSVRVRSLPILGR
ncbi:DUF5615 family PIN-like protein [Micromonospora sp. NBC_01638]|uniref:DUF5615 family PIN-like protein n=1 Tax=Micromonospora sp. NBC_01638 TaxID=2975982 RepID=UPI003863C085|nr:DUF5615 family PIN-like protein [Micromonospora sp. NBC_01638]